MQRTEENIRSKNKFELTPAEIAVSLEMNISSHTTNCETASRFEVHLVLEVGHGKGISPVPVNPHRLEGLV